jgi:hypothetical protein
MTPRRYALRTIALLFGFFFSIVGVNLVIDPQGVFGTGLIPTTRDANSRYHTFAAYKQAAERYDGLAFGSSRAHSVPLDHLNRRTHGVNFASFAVNSGQITDHLPVLEYVVRQKATKGEPLRAVFLLIDADNFGVRSWTNRTIQSMLPPELTGESAGRFWWKNLTAIQPGAWRDSLRQFKRGPQASPSVPGQALLNRSAEPLPGRAELALQLKMLERFVALCREHGVSLTVATTPLNRGNASWSDQDSLAEVVEQISRIVAVWDFSRTEWLAGQPRFWLDTSHFNPEVGLMMLSRIFGGPMPPEWADFGELVRPSTAKAP